MVWCLVCLTVFILSDVSWTHTDEIPASKMAALHFHFISLFFSPYISNYLGAMVYPLFNANVHFLLQNYCCWPKVRRIWEINYVWNPTFFCPFLVDMLFLKILTKADVCQISCWRCRKSLLAHVIILYNVPAAVLNGSCFSHFSCSRSSQLFTWESGIFSLLKKIKVLWLQSVVWSLLFRWSLVFLAMWVVFKTLL